MTHAGRRCSRFAVVLILATGLTLPADAQTAPACDSITGYHLLDFWLGEWDVYVGATLVGENRIETILNGCAIMEHWRSGRGGEGKSLFYYDPAADAWTQIWITDRATAPGGLKHKRLTHVLEDGALRFEGTVTPIGGEAYLDRTTLTPLPGGRVRQTIEVSTDGGMTWEVRFQAEYRRRSSGS